MKSVISLLAVLLFVAVPVFADPDRGAESEKNDSSEMLAQCPKTTITDQDLCFKCHVSPGFGIKEERLGDGRVIGRYLRSDGNKVYAHYALGGVGASALDDLQEIRGYIHQHPGVIDRLVVDILSPGGSLFHGWSIVGLFGELKSMGVTVETRCMGFAASAAFLIFASGHDRVASPTAEFMWHEVRSFAFFDEKNPSKLEDEARIFRHLQTTANKHLASVSNVTKTWLDKGIDKDEIWLTGKEMLKYGFADRLVK